MGLRVNYGTPGRRRLAHQSVSATLLASFSSHDPRVAAGSVSHRSLSALQARLLFIFQLIRN